MYSSLHCIYDCKVHQDHWHVKKLRSVEYTEVRANISLSYELHSK